MMNDEMTPSRDTLRGGVESPIGGVCLNHWAHDPVSSSVKTRSRRSDHGIRVEETGEEMAVSREQQEFRMQVVLASQGFRVTTVLEV